MRLWMTLAVVLVLAAATDLALRGLPALDGAARASTALQGRTRALSERLVELPPLSYAEVDDLVARTAHLAAREAQYLAALTTDTVEDPPLELEAALARNRLKGLEPGGALATHLADQAFGRPRLAQAISRVLGVLHQAGAETLESWEVADDGAARPVDGLPTLESHTFDLILVSEVPEILEVIEDLVPGRGEPVLSLQGLSIRRIEPALWPDRPEGLISPPVRAALRVTAMFRSAPPGEGGSGS